MSTLIAFTRGVGRVGLGRTTAYAQAGDLVTAPIVVGNKSMIPEAEVEAQRLARVAGFKPEELRELVRKLTAARQELASDEQIAAIVRQMQADRLARGAKVDPGRPLRVEAARKLAAARRSAEVLAVCPDEKVPS
jgi:hypothetical protein